MISGASEKELDIANDRADLLLEIQQLQEENKELKSKIKRILDIIDKQLLDGELVTYDKFRQKLIDAVSDKDE